MAPIRVVINGATGKMGTETVAAVCREDDLSLVGATCRRERGGTLSLPTGGEVPLSTNLEDILEQTRPDVIVDFTNAAACLEAVPVAAAHSANLVLGVSGLTDDDLRQLDALANDRNIGIIVAPNFALGAVILKKLVEQAAPFFDYVDIVESHHEAKIDSPSGFAMALAKAIGDEKRFTRNYPEKENLPDTRGGEYNGVDHPQHPNAGPQRAPRGNNGGRRADHLPAPRHPHPGLLYARRNPVHPGSCEASGPCGRLGKYTGFVAGSGLYNAPLPDKKRRSSPR